MEIKLKHVSADYRVGPMRSPLILNNVDLQIKTGSLTAVVGHTGSGKSSLLKTMNGLLMPKEGNVYIGPYEINQKINKKELKKIRQVVGMVFQFPESQLFAETVEKDICFGPLNFGVSLSEAKKIASEVIELVGLDQSILSKSPHALSGGQKRRVAIAGILAMKPDILVLDEPGAGLDPEGKKEIMNLILRQNEEFNITTILVTHDMEDLARYMKDVIVMDKGKIVYHDSVRKLFENPKLVSDWNLDFPEARKLQLKIEQEFQIRFPSIALTEEELANSLIEVGLI